MTRRTILALAVTALITGCAGTRDGAPSEDANAPGLRVGDQVPPVTLEDADGNPIMLSSLYADAPLVVIFYRGGWCPFCTRQLKDWRDDVADVRADGANFVAVTPESPDNYARTAAKNDLNYTVLGDPTLDAAKAFRLYFKLDDDEIAKYERHGVDIAAANASGEWELPAPGTFIIDQDGIIRYADADWDYTQRADPEDVLEALKKITG